MPVLNSNDWKSKSREVMISYLVYIKTELDRQPSLIEQAELKSAVRLATNHGIQSPQETSIHFSQAFGNKINLKDFFPGIQWTLVDAAYLPANPTNVERQSWHNFLIDLGVVDFLRVKPVEVKFDKSTIHETPWAVYKDFWPDSPDGYAVTDYQCEELHELLSTAADYPKERAIREMATLFELLDNLWSTEYSKFIPTQLRSGSGHILKEVIETSFALHLKTLPWIPAEWAVVTVEEDGVTAKVSHENDICKGSDIFVDCPLVRKRLAHTVRYLTVAPKGSNGFIDFLGIRDSVSPSEAKKVFITWCERHPDKPNSPATFCTTKNHIVDIYTMIEDELPGKEAQDVFHNHPAIFVPVSAYTKDHIVVGKMMARDEVWWHDPTGLFTKYRKSLLNFKSPLGMLRTVVEFYGKDMEKLFHNIARLQWEPTTLQLAQLLQHVASAKTLFEEDTLGECLCLFSHIGARLAKIGEKVAGVPSPEASRQEVELQPVLSLLGGAAVFPSHRNEWVNPGQQLLMQVDSSQLEEMFRTKAGVHFLVTKPQKSLGKRLWMDDKAIQHFVGLFETIKSLSDCVKTEEITEGFKQCISGQTYLHRVVGLIQRFLFFVFPDVYKEIRPGQAEALKQLMFVEVRRLQMKYELEGHPEIFEIRQEKCVKKDEHFYFHEEYVSNQAEINREIANYFSCGDKGCSRELVSFLTQAVPILEGKSSESMESLLSRQQKEVRELPPSEEVWTVPLPIIQEPEPVPEPEPEEPEMVYGRGLDSFQSDNASQEGGSGENVQGQDESLKSWPPRSALNVNESQQRPKKDSEKAEAPAGMWPPPQPPNSSRSAKTLPSNIRVEREPAQDEGKEEQRKSVEDLNLRGSGEGRGNLSRQSSNTSSSAQASGHPRQQSREEGEAEGRQKTPQDASGDGTGDSRKERSGYERGQDGSTSKRNSGFDSQPSLEEPGSGEKQSPNQCKRKASDSLREGEPAVTKKINSVTDDNSEREKESGLRGQAPKGHGSDTTSSMDVTPSTSNTSQGSQSEQNKDKRRIHFTIPMWSESSQNLEYTDLSKDISSTLPSLDIQDLEHEQSDVTLKIGRWGEMLVLDYLMRLKDSDSSIEAVLWANAEGEKGLPWDFELVYIGMEGSVYIEVKTTVTQDREVFEVSSGQMELALKEGNKFQVYRVFGAGKPEPRLLRVENVAERMRTKQLKLFMLL